MLSSDKRKLHEQVEVPAAVRLLLATQPSQLSSRFLDGSFPASCPGCTILLRGHISLIVYVYVYMRAYL